MIHTDGTPTIANGHNDVLAEMAETAKASTKQNPRYMALEPLLLAKLLGDARVRHEQHEARNGPYPDWSRFYAEYLLGIRD